MSEIPNKTFEWTGFPLDRAPAEVVAFLRLFATADQPLVGYTQKDWHTIIANYGPEENRRTETVTTTAKIPFEVKKGQTYPNPHHWYEQEQ